MLGESLATSMGESPSTTLGESPQTSVGESPSTSVGESPATKLGESPSTTLGESPAYKTLGAPTPRVSTMLGAPKLPRRSSRQRQETSLFQAKMSGKIHKTKPQKPGGGKPSDPPSRKAGSRYFCHPFCRYFDHPFCAFKAPP